MRIAPKLTLMFVMAALLPLLTIGYAGTYLIDQLGEKAVVASLANAIEAEKARLSQLALDKTRIVRDFLGEYYRDVVMLRNHYELICSSSSQLEPRCLQLPYFDRDTAGLPGYGYIHPVNGAYGDWDGRRRDGVLWIRRGLVERARKEPEFCAEATEILNCMAAFMPLQFSVFKKHHDSCDLVWVVSTTGIISTCPDEYSGGVASDPSLADLDETGEEYITLYTPEMNPAREIRWMQPYVDIVKGIQMISCIAPLYHGDRFLGTLGADVTIQELVEWLRGLQIGKAGYAFMISSTGAPIALPDSAIDELVLEPTLRTALREACKPHNKQSWNGGLEKAMQGSIVDGGPQQLRMLYRSMIEQKSGAELIEFSDEKKIVAYRPIGAAGWSIGLVIPVAEALSPLQPVLAGINSARANYIFTLTLFIVFSALIAGMVGAWGGRKFAGPINDLINSIFAISSGNAWRNIDTTGDDELKKLADSANVMVRRIAENEQILDALFNGVSDAIFVHDGATGRILRVNGRMCEMFRCTMEQALQDDVDITSSGIPPFTAENGGKLIARAVAGEIPVFEWQSRDLSGRVFWTEVALRRIELSGKPCVIATVRDISSRKEADEKLRRVEEQLRQAQKLESIGRLAGGVAHDFNNMLTPILGYTQIIKQMIPASDRLRPMIDQIGAAGGRCRALVSQLLAFARKQVLDLKPTDLNKILTGFESMLRRTLRENIRLEFRLSPGLKNIQSDVGQIEQIILNLALNAQQAMPEGGDLIIETSSLPPDPDSTEFRKDLAVEWNPEGRLRPEGALLEEVLLSVRDTGVGIDQESLVHLFEPFFTTHGHGAGQGTGLGLSIVHGIVKQHGGSITVASEVGRGTTIRVYFPACTIPVDGSVEQADTKMETARGHEKILIVEDQDMVRDLTTSMLREFGYEPFAAANGAEAVAIVEREKGNIDMVLMDVILPDMTGKQVCEKLRKTAGRGLKVLYMSGYTADVIDNHGVLEPGTMFIQKPFEIKDLAAKIRETLMKPV